MTQETTGYSERNNAAAMPQVTDNPNLTKAEGAETKVCKGCGREYPLSEFPIHKKSSDGHAHLCKECFHRRYKERGRGVRAKANPLEKFTSREMMRELFARGYRGELTFTETKVHKCNLSQM